mgnify:CR=1 FL=1
MSKLDKKPKKGVAVVISIGPKMKTKPTDAATPEMPIKKYGSMPMKKTWQTLKALPQHQMFGPAYERANLAEDTYQGEGVDVGERQEGAGTIHPAIYAMMQRRMKENPHLTSGSYNDENADLPNLNLRANESALDYRDGKTPTLDMHPEYYADSMPYGSLTDEPMDAYANKDNQRRTKAPQSYSYQQTHPTNEEVRDFKDDYAPWMQRGLKNTNLGRRAASEGKQEYEPMQKAFEMLKQNHAREDNMTTTALNGARVRYDTRAQPSGYDDEGFPEHGMEDMGPPYGKPEFGDEDAREAEMNQAERAAIMAEGVPEMQRPRSAPRPGDPRFADPNKPRPSMPRDIFQNRR